MLSSFKLRPSPSPRRPHGAAGFTLVEMSVVLVVIGVIIGAVSIGRDLQRNAVYQRIANDHVNAWTSAYERFYDGSGRPPGDSATAPTGMVAGAPDTPLCGLALRSAMLAAGVELPAGRAVGAEDRYAYLDTNGNPQELAVCFSNVAWSEPGNAPGVYVPRRRNVMQLSGVTPALAVLLDTQADSQADAGLGRMRQANRSAGGGVSAAWSADETTSIDTKVAAGSEETQVTVLSAALKMLR